MDSAVRSLESVPLRGDAARIPGHAIERVYCKLARARFRATASDMRLGRIWVAWQMMWYHPIDDKTAPESIRTALWEDRQR